MAHEYLSRKDVEHILAERANRDESFRAELLANPKEVISREFDIGEMPEDLRISVIEETPDEIYIVLPSSSMQRASLDRITMQLRWFSPSDE